MSTQDHEWEERWSALLEQVAASPNPDEGHVAHHVVSLFECLFLPREMWLENWRDGFVPAIYGEHQLTPEEYDTLVDTILARIAADSTATPPSLVWALGASYANRILPDVLKLLRETAAQRHEELSYQCLIALDNLVSEGARSKARSDLIVDEPDLRGRISADLQEVRAELAGLSERVAEAAAWLIEGPPPEEGT